jgi:hypothetical protein
VSALDDCSRELVKVCHRVRRLVARAPARPRRRDRARCGARTRDGSPCEARVVWLPGEPAPRGRCRLHGGLSTGPRSIEGLRRAVAALGHDPDRSPAVTRARAAAASGPRGCSVCQGEPVRCAWCRAAYARDRARSVAPG